MRKDLYQRYLNNLAEGHDLIKKNLFTNASNQSELLRQIQENSVRTYQLRLENDALLKEFLYTRKAEDLTEQDVRELEEFADELYSFVYQNDIGVSYRIHQLLYEHAILTRDFDRTIRQLYYLGTNLFYLNVQMNELGINLFGKQVTALFKQAADHFSEYEQIQNPQTRGYIMRSLTNLWLSDESTTCRHQPGTSADPLSGYRAFNDYFHRLLDIYNSPHYQSLPATFPREQAIYNLHYNRSQYFQDLQLELPESVARELLESAQYIYDHQYKFQSKGNIVQRGHLEYIYAVSKCRMGLITRPQLLELLFELIESADQDNFSVDGITTNLELPLYLEYTYNVMTDEERRPYLAKLNMISQQTNSYLLHAPHNEFSNVITRAVGDSIRYRVRHGKPLQHQMFNALLFCHPPTYIHVYVVASLSQKLLMRMAMVSPEKLIGLYGMKDPDEIRAKAHRLGEQIYLCALYHDIGKLMLLDYISIYSRKLLDEEFEAIKLHTQIGAMLLEKLDTPELCAITKYHHRFYDGTGGYPADCGACPPEFKALVDIVTICDSIEAATDNIGRCYSAAKTFPQIIDELREKSGTRYSPDVMALFDDPGFFESAEATLRKERQDAYFEIYGSSADLYHS